MRGTWQGGGTWQTTGGGGRLVLAVIAAAVLLGSGAASAIASALVTILIVAAVVIVLAAAGLVAWLVHQTRQGPKSASTWRISAPPVYQLPADSRTQLEASQRPAIEPPREIHLHFHTADPAEAAAIIRTAIPGPAGDAITEGK